MAPKGGYGRESDDDAPWLAEVESDGRASTAVPRGRLIGGIIVALLLLVLIITGVYVIAAKKQDGASGVGVARAEDAPLIAADAGPYKVKPEEAGGLQVDGQGDSVYTAGGGEDPAGQIDAARTPEDPMARPGSEPVSILPDAAETLPAIPPAPEAATKTAPETKPAAVATLPVPKPTAPKPAAPKPAVTVPLPKAEPAAAKAVAPPAAAAATGQTLQLGAFSTSAAAEAAWKSLSGRFAYLAPLAKRIEPVARDGGTLYRLRASGAASPAVAADLCARLKIAGESCLVTP